MPTTTANGIELYYEEHGDPSAEPLLCVMGLSADTLNWALNTAAFAERHRTVIFDNRDVGRSSYVEEPYEIADMAADTLALADALGLERFHLLGVSMGGAIAQELALAAPGRVRTLTLAVTFARGGGWAKQLARVWGARRMAISHEQHMEELLLLNLSEGLVEHDGAFEYARGLALSNPNPQRPEGFVRQLEASSRHDARDRLGSLALPAHVISAEHDILVPAWKQRELHELIPGSRLTVIENGAHGISTERALDFNAAVLDFIASAASGAPAQG